MMYIRPARRLGNDDRGVEVRHRLACMAAAACLLFGSSAMAAGDPPPAQDLIMRVTSSLIEVLNSERELLANEPGRVYELANRLVIPHFDFERMARRALGKRWKEATPEQQARFIAAFRTLLVRTYATVINEYRGQEVTYLDPIPRKKDTEVVVPVQIELTASQTVRVAYAMHVSGSDWKVFDVAIDGVSLVKTYRSSFRSEVARHGIDGLSARLEARNSATN